MNDSMFLFRWMMRETLTGFFFLICVSAIVGYVINTLRSNPLPFIYQSPEKRLEHFAKQRALNASVISKVEMIDLKGLQQMITTEQSLLLDARSSLFYKLGHLPGAFNLSSSAFEQDYAKLQQKLHQYQGKSIIVYCAEESCKDSQIVAQALIRMGFPRIYLFNSDFKKESSIG